METVKPFYLQGTDGPMTPETITALKAVAWVDCFLILAIVFIFVFKRELFK